jgi:hypothetical protein
MIRQNRFMRSILILVAAVLCLPAAAWSQAQAPAAAPAPETQQAAPAAPAAPEAPAAPAAEQPGTYTIKEGDTLWDISGAHYRDPFLWPLIWQSNPSITDPDRIYPGKALVIPSLAPVERAMSTSREAAAPVEEQAAPAAPAPPAPASASQREESAPATPSFFRQRTIESTAQEVRAPSTGSRLVLPENAALPLVDKYAMLRGGFIGTENSQDFIIGSIDDTGKGFHGKNVHATGQDVFLKFSSRQQVNIGERFIAYAPVREVRHPESGDSCGTLYKVNGVVKVKTAHENGVYVAEIILAFDTVMKDDMLAPYEEPEPILASKEKRTKNLAGALIATTDGQSASGTGNIIYLDKGKTNGVEQGDWFSVYAGQTNESGVPQYLGDVLVFIVKDRTATALIQRSVREMSIGDRFQRKN